MSTLAVVEEILRETAVPMSVREIVERAGARLPSKSKTPDTVVARDLSMDIKKKGESSIFIRTSPGRYTLRVYAMQAQQAQAAQNAQPPVAQTTQAASPEAAQPQPQPAQPQPAQQADVAPQPMSALATRKPAAPAPSTARPAVAGRADSAEGGGYAS